MFGGELEATRRVPLEPGRALPLLPPAPLPEDMEWARPNPRVADAMARWTAAVECEAVKVISPRAKAVVKASLEDWRGEQMPISRYWATVETNGLTGEDLAVARLAIVLAKAPYQVDEQMAEAVLDYCDDEERFIRILAWASFTGARRFAQLVAERAAGEPMQHAAAPEHFVTQFAPGCAA